MYLRAEGWVGGQSLSLSPSPSLSFLLSFASWDRFPTAPSRHPSLLIHGQHVRVYETGCPVTNHEILPPAKIY